jgi:pimeloyl-ACP methyl ester carboxylesterase
VSTSRRGRPDRDGGAATDQRGWSPPPVRFRQAGRLLGVRKILTGIAAVAAVLAILRLGGPLVVASNVPPMELETGPDSRTLVVVVHGFGGISRPGLVELAHTAFPGAHLIAPAYSTGPFKAFSNRDPYDIADVLENRIDEAFRRHAYDRIVLIGHSMGGELLRKVYLWGAGQEEDRPARRGRHAWVDRVERFVSLASINRGWTTDPAPENMLWYRRVEYAVGTVIARLTGTGKMIYAVQRGAPFVADSRVQWIRLARQNAGQPLPLLIHLLGTRDDIATKADVMDSQVAKDFKFKSLPGTDHADIATALADEIGPSGPLTERARIILECVTLPPDQLTFDEPIKLVEDPKVRRLVFILHGIRDYQTWGAELKRQIDAELGPDSDTVVVVPKYGYFPMAPFLLWSDRQAKVRWFMDEYTEELAHYPSATTFDFIGHSNGTYILASALQKYKTLKVNDVYFAGSVVPQRYRWSELVRAERVRRVRNVVASSDWVVAIFPRLYEQIAEWRGVDGDIGKLDIGAAGYRGFSDAGLPKSGVRDILFAAGSHGTGVDLDVGKKREALVRFGRYGLDDDQERVFDEAFRNGGPPHGFIDGLSNVSWVAWVAIIVAVAGVGALLWRWKKYWAVVPYIAAVLLFLNSF